MIVKPYFEDLHTLHVNTEANRAYYIPAGKEGNYFLDRTSSDRFQTLNGLWKFRYVSSIYELKENFFEEDSLLEGFTEQEVPGMWQNYGVDSNQYINTRYPIPLDPPYVPRENPCGAYRTEFEYHRLEEAPEVYLNFEGVDSCFYLWINGSFVGYSQVSHSTSEFHVTEYLKEGTNTLSVLVLKWCDGTYLEDQDKFRMSGIFRDVYLLKRPEQGIRDYKLTAEPIGIDAETHTVCEKAVIHCEIEFFGEEQIPVSYEIRTAEGETVCSGITETGVIEAELEQALLWSAELPVLYTIVLKTENEYITDRFGVRKGYVRDGVFYFNDVPLKFHGMNRHDSDPVTGFVISEEQMRKDLDLMKEHNVNAIRTSHYPNAPQYYHLYDEYGFYVIDEADNESHGTDKGFKKVDDWETHMEKWNRRIADNPDFIEATVDRVQRCVHRDKNRSSVIIWSMGNECAYGCTFEAAQKWTKEFDPSRLCHYESARYVRSDKKYDYSTLDFYSRMYPDFEEIHRYFERKHKNPYLMCEYCHAMGNGPGDLEDYFEIIHQYDGMAGGFVWEWCDHAIYDGVTEEGKVRYLYGGDSGEAFHDGNFCVDGMVFPDRRPSTGLMEFKQVYRPMRALSWDAETGRLVLRNYLDFRSADSYLRMRCELIVNGKIAETQEIEQLPHILPHQDGEISLNWNAGYSNTDEVYLRLIYLLKEAEYRLPAGFELGHEEIRIQEGEQLLFCTLEKEGTEALQVSEGERWIEIGNQQFSCCYDKFSGSVCRYTSGKETILDAPIEYNVWRAPTDNDRRIRLEWERAGYDRAIFRTYNTDVITEKNCVRIRTTAAATAVHIQHFLDLDTEWTIWADGTVEAAVQVKKDPEFPFLPRFGLRMRLPKAYQNVEYQGIGPVESYQDKHYAGYHGVFKQTVAELHEDYIKPQENGSHFDCSYVKAGVNGKYLLVTAEKKFSFNASAYTQEELSRKKHNYELQEDQNVILCVDYRQSGIGSASCGPALLKKYQFNEEEFAFHIKMKVVEE